MNTTQLTQTLTIDHMLLECALLQECRDEYYTVDTLNALFQTIPETCIVEFLRWCNLSTSTSSETWTIWSDLSNLFRKWKQLWDTFTCVGRLICPEGRVSSLNKSNPIQSRAFWSHKCRLRHEILVLHDTHWTLFGRFVWISYICLLNEIVSPSDEYLTADSLNTLFETVPQTCIVELLQEAGFFWFDLSDLNAPHLNHPRTELFFTSSSPQTWAPF